jgi:microcystin-dependent protein
VDGATLGAVGGAQSKTLTEANLPPHAHGQTAQNPTFNLNVSTANDFQRNAAGGGVTAVSVGAGTNFTTSSDLTPGNTDNGSGTSTAIPILPPAIVANFGIVTE